MALIKFKSQDIHTSGVLPELNIEAPTFKLTADDLNDLSLEDFTGKRVVLNIFPSIDTDVCAASVRKFNVEVEKLSNTVVLCISKDLPFAQKRFCAAEGLNNVITLSEYKNNDFGKDYGVKIIDGPLEGLFSRAVVVIDEKGRVIYTEQVPEITEEPKYEPVVSILS